jgi:thiol-disulfide isomerase/thioredoxin
MGTARAAVLLGVNPGLVVVLVVLVASGSFGLYRRVTDGRIRGVDRSDGGHDAADGTAPGTAPDEAQPLFSPSEQQALGLALGSRATLVQFSTSFCQPCRATRRILTEVADQLDGVSHQEIDAEAHLDLVRRLDITRTPTVLVLDGAGLLVRRAVGQPRKADVVAALGEAIP